MFQIFCFQKFPTVFNENFKKNCIFSEKILFQKYKWRILITQILIKFPFRTFFVLFYI